MMSPTLQWSSLHMRAVRSPEMNSPLANLAKVDEDAPIARRRSVFVMSLSISCFHSFLYDTVTTLPLNERANYTISGENWERHICFFAQKVFITKLCVRFRTNFQSEQFFSEFLRGRGNKHPHEQMPDKKRNRSPKPLHGCGADTRLCRRPPRVAPEALAPAPAYAESR